MEVCHTDRLYHYILNGDEAIDAIVEQGLLPLSAMPDHPRWLSVRTLYPHHFESLHKLFAEPVAATPCRNSGIFLTPIDFRALPDQSLSRYRRLTIPLAAIKPTEAAVTNEWEATRIVLPLSEDTLKEVQNRWTADVVRTWFGRDRHRLFFHVPQVVTYQERIPIPSEWVD